ncbi:D-2-hydroxyacid dehydrogenase [Capnocytophaga canimorsus]|uniref:D-3-phosphoglycerate dehydrogenase n=2 Tax=Capnocytophaga canimorsus TaxID=28188 RepID=F9YQF3_CAPCC|nr:D-2-hydroxyacid dehydrogenase [Capnocytophaga canimorsus]AEK22321.1 D-3-phosphoglycerate dehydrogenase [Capnocytophaga canimorsus Cc5]CEN52296.1 D-3-phosphoglycerate dehydrogenase [Capnocytophaga canimorsus]
MKILANDGISEKGKQLLTDNGFEVITTKVAQNQLANFINEQKIGVLLVRSATTARRDLIDACPSLKLIGRGGVGMDNIDVDYALKKGIHVINTPYSAANSVAELVFAHLLSGIRFLHDANRNMPLQGDADFEILKKSYSQGSELRDKTLGIIGLGRIGQSVARMAIGLGMRVIAHDPAVQQTTIEIPFFDGRKLDFLIETTDKQTVLETSDFITLHVPFQQEYIIDEVDFEIMKDGVGIINIARGGVINEAALLEALDNEKVSFAGLDVYENEPTPAIRTLMHPKVSLTPHIGASTSESQNRIGEELATQIISLLK